MRAWHLANAKVGESSHAKGSHGGIYCWWVFDLLTHTNAHRSITDTHNSHNISRLAARKRSDEILQASMLNRYIFEQHTFTRVNWAYSLFFLTYYLPRVTF